MTKDEEIALRRVMSEVVDPVVVELGAYRGEDSAFLESLGKGSVLHVMVEPDPHNHRHIMELGNGRRLIEGAVAARTGWRPFHFSDDEHHVCGSGSLLQPTGHLQHFPQIKFEPGATVPCYSLDDIFTMECPGHIDLLYVDVQGAEAEMIAGGQRALAHTHYLFMEAELIELYEGQLTRGPLLAMLPEWTVRATLEENVLLENNVFTER